MLVSLKYIEKSGIDLKIKNLLIYLNKLSFGIYIIIPLALAFNILLLSIYVGFDLITLIFIFILTVSGTIFFESFIIDRRYLYYLFNSTRDKFIFWSYFAFSNAFSIYFYTIHINIFFLVFSLSLLNLISLYFLSYLDISEKKIFTMRLILVYNLFIWGSFYLGSLISDGIILIFEDLRGITYFTLLFQNSFLIIFIFSYFLVKVDKKLKSSIEIVLFTLFQGFLAFNWVYIFTLFGLLNFFMMDLILLFETILFFRTFKYLNNIFFERKYPKFLTQSFSLLTLLFYFEASLLSYFLVYGVIGIFESILVSQLLFFVFTVMDIYLIKKIEKGYARLIHTVSYFFISFMIFLTLNQYVEGNPMILSLEIFIFALLQFYTNHSFFTALNQLNQDKVDSINKWKSSFLHILGTLFYLNLSLILFQALLILNVDPQLIFLSLSITIHIFMIIDTHSKKFLGKYTKYIKVISWVLTMISTTTFIIILFYGYFIAFLNTTIPLILFLLTIETVYLFKLLEFWQFVISNKQRIRLILIYNLFIWGSFCLGSIISNGILIIFNQLRGIPYIFLLFQNVTLLLFALSYFLVKADKKLKSSIEIILFLLFQGFFALNWITIFIIFDVLNYFMVDLILLIETCLSYRTFKYLNNISFEGRYPKFLTQSFSILTLLFYFEASLLTYFILIGITGFFVSFLVFQLVFFIFTLFDMYLIKQIERGYMQLIHTVSFFIISLMVLFILNQYVVHYQIMLSIEFLIFSLMQFYTNYSLFSAANQLKQGEIESNEKWKSSIINIIGTWFYLNLSFVLLQVFYLLNVDSQLIFLGLSIFIHILMIIDSYSKKFLGKFTKYIKVISWVSTMISTTTLILFLISTYFFAFLSTTIPLILFLLTIETVYLFKLLEFWEFIFSNKQKIRLILIYNLFIWGSLYLGSIISNGILILFTQLRGIPYIFLLSQNFTLLLFVLSYFLVKIDKKLKSSIEIILFLVFQSFFALNWIAVFIISNVWNLFTFAAIILFETIFFFKTARYFNIIYFETKHPKFLNQIFSVLTLLLYLEISLLIYGMMIEFIGIFESILISQSILFGSTLLEIYLIKKIRRSFAQLIHTVSYFVLSLMIFLILNQYILNFPILLSLEVLFLILMQFYTNHSLFSALNYFNQDKIEILNQWSSRIKKVLGIGFYFILSFAIFQALTLLKVDLQLTLFSLSAMIHLLMLIDTHVLKFIGKVSTYLSLFSWILLMAFIGIYLTHIFTLLDLINYFTVTLVLVIETCFSFRVVKYLNRLFFEEKNPNFLKRAFSSLVITLYFEISFLIYGLMIEFTGIIESILVSQLILFAFSLLDIYALKKIKTTYAQLIHSISYFVISLMIFLVLNQYIIQYPILLSLEVLLFILMQLYTNYSLFETLNQFNPNKVDYYKKKKSKFIQVIGICFYVNILFVLGQTLVLMNTELQLVLLILSLMTHFLMLADEFLLQFLKNLSKYIKVISWIFIMVFTTASIIGVYVSNFMSYLLSSIPLIVLLLIIETAYLLKQMVIWEFVVSNMKRIRAYLIIILYVDLGIWPLYYLTFNPLQVLNLLILSLFIFFILTFVDKYVGALGEKSLITLSKTLFFVIGTLLSVDVYILLEGVPNTNIFFNLNISILIFVFFSGIIVKPFKKHSFIAFSYWAALFSLLSSLIYHLSLSYVLSGVLLFITIVIYPFVFLLEELKELFNKFIDALVKSLRLIKQSIINGFKILGRFIKVNYRSIWKVFSLLIAILSGILLSEWGIGLLVWYHALLLVFGLFGLLYILPPAEDATDADIIFKRRILRLSIGWGSVIFLLFTIIPVEYYILAIFISIAVVGTIVLVYLGRKEEREKISVKWRFYTLLTLFLLLIIFGISLITYI
ncbi:MAG: hypothetical protein ACXACO_13245 [Promethearchaeota archaeon]